MITTPSKPGTFAWPGLIFLFLGLNVSICAVTVYLANSDRSFKVVTDYDTKAASWDKDQAKLRAGEALGWNVQLALKPNAAGTCELTATVQDSAKSPLTNAAVTLEAFHDAFPNDIVKSKFTTNDNREYITSIPVTKEGRWTMQLTIQQGEHVYSKSFLKDVYLPLTTK